MTMNILTIFIFSKLDKTLKDLLWPRLMSAKRNFSGDGFFREASVFPRIMHGNAEKNAAAGQGMFSTSLPLLLYFGGFFRALQNNRFVAIHVFVRGLKLRLQAHFDFRNIHDFPALEAKLSALAFVVLNADE